MVDLSKVLAGVKKDLGRDDPPTTTTSKGPPKKISLKDILRKFTLGNLPGQSRPGFKQKFFPFVQSVAPDPWWEQRFRCSECTTDCADFEALYFSYQDKTIAACPNPICHAKWKSWRPEFDDPSVDPEKIQRSPAMMQYTVHRACGRKHGQMSTGIKITKDTSSNCADFSHKKAGKEIPFLHSICKKLHGSMEPCENGVDLVKSDEQRAREKKKHEINALDIGALRSKLAELDAKTVESQKAVFALLKRVEIERTLQVQLETDREFVRRTITRKESGNNKK